MAPTIATKDESSQCLKYNITEDYENENQTQENQTQDKMRIRHETDYDFARKLKYCLLNFLFESYFGIQDAIIFGLFLCYIS